MAYKLSDHAVPTTVAFSGAVLFIFHRLDRVVKSDRLGNLGRQVDAEAFVHYHVFAVRILRHSHHHVRLALHTTNNRVNAINISRTVPLRERL